MFFIIAPLAIKSLKLVTMFSYRRIWVPSSVVYIHEDSDQSHCHTRHLLYTDHTECYSHCRSNGGNRLSKGKVH